ncbi:MAG TPA: type II toxin-antitoxin system VapB family antitoxin [Microlunatus sp.]|jgi:Arc/MetJ family transcription regulator
MRTTINLDDELVRVASELTGRSEKSALVRLGLEALIVRESSRRLAALGGTDPQASAAPRSRSDA